MVKKILCLMFVVTNIFVCDAFSCKYRNTSNKCVAVIGAPNDGSYMKTNKSVTVYTESGHCKGAYAVYLHKGKKYIDFNNTWICIQGKSRFGYNGNWYVIK